MGRKRTLLGLTVVAVGALTIVSPASALAQDLTQTAIPNVTDPIGSTIDTVTGGGGTSSGSGSTGGGGSGGGSIGGVVDTVTAPVKDTVENTGGNVGTIVDNTGGTVDKVAPGTPIGSTKKVLEETTKRTTDTVTDATGAVTRTVDGVRQTTDGLGPRVLNPILDARSPRNKNRPGDGKSSKDERAAAQRKSAIRAALAGDRSGDAASRAKDRTLAAIERSRRPAGMVPAAGIAAPPRETFLTQLADAAVEATKKLAFPLGLALMVGAFMMVQGRIDRKDAKLALAPIDAEQDLLSFQ